MYGEKQGTFKLVFLWLVCKTQTKIITCLGVFTLSCVKLGYFTFKCNLSYGRAINIVLSRRKFVNKLCRPLVKKLFDISGKNVTMKGCYLWDNVTIGDNCTVETSLICDNVTVYENVTLCPGCVLSPQVCMYGTDTMLKISYLKWHYSLLRIDNMCKVAN